MERYTTFLDWNNQYCGFILFKKKSLGFIDLFYGFLNLSYFLSAVYNFLPSTNFVLIFLILTDGRLGCLRFLFLEVCLYHYNVPSQNCYCCDPQILGLFCGCFFFFFGGGGLERGPYHTACEILLIVPQPDLNPHLLHWKCRVLTTELPQKSPYLIDFGKLCFHCHLS